MLNANNFVYFKLRCYANWRIMRNHFVGLVLLLAGCATIPPPTHSQDLCQIFAEYPAWQQATEASARRWGVPAAVQMSIMYQESSFNGNARPGRVRILGIFPGAHASSAVGYSQALDGTWRLYQHDTGHYWTDRSDFNAAADFVGWYANRAYLKAGIPKDNAFLLYLAYHEGISNFMRRTYLRKPWLIRTARRVQVRASLYRAQWLMCG